MAILMVKETAPCLAEARPEACQVLWALLDRWTALDETRATSEEVEGLYREIVAFWGDAPGAAEEWYEAWHAARSHSHP